MRFGRLAVAVFLLLSTASFVSFALLQGEDSATRRARGAFTEFVAALCEGRRADLRWLVTDECVPYVAHMGEIDRAKGKKPLELLQLDVDGARAIARVRDPNVEAGQPEGEFVLRREDGKWKVDLIASAGRGAKQKALPGGGFRMTQTGLDPEQRYEAARVMEAKYRHLEEGRKD